MTRVACMYARVMHSNLIGDHFYLHIMYIFLTVSASGPLPPAPFPSYFMIGNRVHTGSARTVRAMCRRHAAISWMCCMQQFCVWIPFRRHAHHELVVLHAPVLCPCVGLRLPFPLHQEVSSTTNDFEAHVFFFFKIQIKTLIRPRDRDRGLANPK